MKSHSFVIFQVERDRAEHNLTNIRKTHEKVKEEGKGQCVETT